MTKIKLLETLYFLKEHAVLDADGTKKLRILTEQVETDIRNEQNKTKGTGVNYKAVEKYIKALKDNPRQGLYGAWMQDGKQHICNGYSAYRFNTPMELPVSTGMDMKKLYPENLCAYSEVFFPDEKELKMKLAKCTSKYEKEHVWEPDRDNGITVRVNILLEAMNIFPDARFWADLTNPGFKLKAIYLTSEFGEGLILPCKVDGNEQQE